MAVTTYTKALYTGVGALTVHDGSAASVSAIANMCGAASIPFRIMLGYVYVNDELIEIGDGACVTDDEVPLAHAKIPRETLLADEWQIDGIVYDGSNLGEIADFVGIDNVVVHDETLYVMDAVIAEDDVVAKNAGTIIGKIAAGRIGTDYEPVEG